MPRDGAATRDRLLDSAERLVLAKGFSATSVDQILEDASSSKGAFFHHFASKQALAHALVERWVDSDLATMQAGLTAVRDIENPIDRLLSFVSHFEKWAESLVAEDTSCLYIAALSERDLLNSETVYEVERGVRGWRQAVSALLRDAYAHADVANAPDPDELADHLFATFEGSFLLCRTLRTAEPMRAQLRVFRQLLTSLLDT
ncbi:TetR family transcriptional regulator [Aeromicrobium sp.]|uniref:TetR/AcrR family transcriptional regulator n=1 Tax=Aeromicrobium sp. TaxID=1871063 RepID=UPI0030C4A319